MTELNLSSQTRQAPDDRRRPDSSGYENSWRQDWFEPLPPQAQAVFDMAVTNLDISYSMMSVALNEAFTQLGQCQLVRARAQVAVSADLAARLEAHLYRLLRASQQIGQRVSWRGNRRSRVTALDSASFRHAVGREAARGPSALCLIFFSAGMRFRWKIARLTDVTRAVVRRFRGTAVDIADGTCIHPAECWGDLERLHDDLNTCVREVVVQLKLLLRVIPESSLAPLAAELTAYPEAGPAPLPIAAVTLPAPPLRVST